MTVSTDTIVGSWYAADPGGGTDQIVFTFLANGTFLVADKGTHALDPTGQSGIEWGTYSWDAATGAVSFSAAINTDGEWGLSHSHITSATAIDNVLTFSGSEGTFSVPRLMSPPDSVVGSWYNAPTDPHGGTDQIVFTFLNDGTFLVADKGNSARDPNGTSGIEWGTYTWNPVTAVLGVTTQGQTDGQWGFATAVPEFANFGAAVQVDGLLITPPPPENGGALLQRLSPLTASIINGTPGVDLLVGTSASDTISGLASNDTITGAGANDAIDGGAGIDTASYAGTRAAFTLTKTAGGFNVIDNAGGEGSDTLTAIERLHFSNTNVALDLDGNAGNVARILGAVFGADQVANKAYVGIGLSFLDGGMSYQALMDLAINFKLGGSAGSHAAVVNLLYGNVVGGAPPANLLAQYVGMLDSGSQTSGSLGVLAAALPQNEAHINLTGLAQTGIEFV